MNKRLGKNSRSLLREITESVPNKHKEAAYEARAEHIISSAIYLLESLERHYGPEEVEYLKKRFLSSIKGKDPQRFSRGIKKLKEDKE